MPGVTGPLATKAPIDFVVVREGTEGPYVGAGGVLAEGTDAEIATEESLNTRRGAERVIRDAFVRASARDRKKLTLVHKNNVLTRAGGLWTRTFNQVAKEFPNVTTDYLHVDAASMFFVTNPERFDVVVTDNLFGDILTDIAAAICGGIGLAASGNINPTGAFPSMFEPVHGSAPDIAGKNLADPTATVMSVAMMLDHLGLNDAARDVEKAVAADLASRGDAKRGTTEIGSALAELCDALEVKYEWIRNSTKQTIQNAYLNKLFRYQQEAHFVIDDIAQTAKIVGIDGFGRLGLQLKEQVRYFNNKEISYIL